MSRNQIDDVLSSLSQLENKLTKNQSVMLNCFRSSSQFDSETIFTEPQKSKGKDALKSCVKNTRKKGNDRKTKTQTSSRKRSPSPSTDDSMIDTNSEAQDQPKDFVVESCTAETSNSSQKSLNQIPNAFNSKRRRQNSDESLGNAFVPVRSEKQPKFNSWLDQQPSEAPFDCASIMSEDVYP